MKRARLLADDSLALPQLPREVVGLILAATPLDADLSYQRLVALRQVSRHFRAGLVNQTRHLIDRVRSEVSDYVAQFSDQEQDFHMRPTPYYTLCDSWPRVEVVPEQRVYTNRALLDRLDRALSSDSEDPEQLWQLLTRLMLAGAWRHINCHRSLRPDTTMTPHFFNLKHVQALGLARAPHWGQCDTIEQVFYGWRDEKTGRLETAPLHAHPHLRRVTNLTSTNMAQFVKSYASDCPFVVMAMTRRPPGAGKISAYFDIVSRLPVKGTGDEHERWLRFGPEWSECREGQRMAETVVYMPSLASYRHIYADDAEMKAFRATLFYTRLASTQQQDVTKLYCVYQTIQNLPPLVLLIDGNPPTQ